MQIDRQRWVTRLVLIGVLATGAWGLGSLVEPDGGAGTDRRPQVQCSSPSHLTQTYTCGARG